MPEEKKKEEKKLVPDWPRPEMDEVNEDQEKVIQELLDRLIRKYQDAPADPELTEKEKKELEKKIAENPFENGPLWPRGPPPKDVAEMSEEDQRILMYKFAVARKYKMEEAEKMARATWQFKTKYNFWNEKAYFPCCFPATGYDPEAVNKELGLETRVKPEGQIEGAYRTIIQHHQVIWHKWDNRGHPVLIERTGAIRSKSLVAGCKSIAKVGQPIWEPMLDYHVYFNEVGARLMEYQDRTVGKAEGRRILSFTAVMDCKNLGMGHMHNPALDILKKVWACDAAHYPEGLHKCLIVNCPGSIEFLFRIVKGWMDVRVREKLVFLKEDKTTQALLEVIDAENLPEFLGGKDIDPFEGLAAAQEAADQEADEVKTEEITVKAGKNETREFELVVGDEMTWEFEVVDKNIDFSVTFIPDEGAAAVVPGTPSTPQTAGAESPAGAEGEDGANKEEGANASFAVQEKGKSSGHASNYVAKQPGKLVMTWDNSYSWLKGKTLRMRLIKIPAA